jgi:excinuclease UvrABC nuclease subunit
LQLKEAMHIIRKIFPYRDTKCMPAEEMLAKGKKPKACFNRHIGLCFGVCTGEVSKAEYRKMIRRIVLLFQGKKGELVRSLERDMKTAAKGERFEEAATLKRQCFALQHIQDVSLIKDEYRRPHGRGDTRIEAYDVAHLGGSAAVGVMTVVEDSVATKSEYRKFRLREAKPGDDPGSLREILSRRLAHQEWPLPRILVVDGATAQINVAQRLLKELGLGIPVVGVVKDEKHRPREIRGDREIVSGRERDILFANAEAHRFAIAFHRRKSRKDLTK